MGEKAKGPKGLELSRRGFLKATAAAAATGAMMDFAPAPATATPWWTEATTDYVTTCPYCSASCGQVVKVGNTTSTVYEIHGDPASPINQGGLCAKGAAAIQLVNNARRLGVAANTDPVFTYTSNTTSYPTGVAYKRTGDGAWSRVDLKTSLEDIAAKMFAARGAITPGLTSASQSKKVMFFGSSHMNNEQNYMYRKLIADFGTQCVEHQARI